MVNASLPLGNPAEKVTQPLPVRELENGPALNGQVPSAPQALTAVQYRHYEFLCLSTPRVQSLSAPISSQLTLEPTGSPLQGPYWVKQSIPDFFTVTVSKAGATELSSNAPALWVSAVCLGIDSLLAALMTSWPLQIRRKIETLLFVEKIFKSFSGNLLAAWWLGLCAFTAEDKPHNQEKKEKFDYKKKY